MTREEYREKLAESLKRIEESGPKPHSRWLDAKGTVWRVQSAAIISRSLRGCYTVVQDDVPRDDAILWVVSPQAFGRELFPMPNPNV